MSRLHGRLHTIQLSPQTSATPPAFMYAVRGRGVALKSAPCSGARTWYRWWNFDWECDLAVQFSPRFGSWVPLLRAGTIASVQLLRSWPWGKIWLLSWFSTLDGLVWRHLTNAAAFSAFRAHDVPDKTPKTLKITTSYTKNVELALVHARYCSLVDTFSSFVWSVCLFLIRCSTDENRDNN